MAYTGACHASVIADNDKIKWEVDGTVKHRIISLREELNGRKTR